MAMLASRARHQDPGLALSSQKTSYVGSQILNAFGPFPCMETTYTVLPSSYAYYCDCNTSAD